MKQRSMAEFYEMERLINLAYELANLLIVLIDYREDFTSEMRGHLEHIMFNRREDFEKLQELSSEIEGASAKLPDLDMVIEVVNDLLEGR